MIIVAFPVWGFINEDLSVLIQSPLSPSGHTCISTWELLLIYNGVAFYTSYILLDDVSVYVIM